ncbi:hypothetical protein M3Y99_00806800 [Aphelenchoides fujianensis]|nr:hypothetical protein M3Y99_00806800 [Aphelenchoides fujianensis]
MSEVELEDRGRRNSMEKIHLDVLRFLDSRSLQHAPFVCRRFDSLVRQHLRDVARPHLEIVQIRQLDDDPLVPFFSCRCLPSTGAVRQFRAVSIGAAVEWLRPLLAGTFVRLFNLQNVDLTAEVLEALRRLPADFRLVQLSFVGVSFVHSLPPELAALLSGELRAARFYFGRLRGVRPADFFDRMLESEAFRRAEKIQIDVATYVERPFLGFSDDAILRWFFAARPLQGYGVMIVRDVELGDDFLAKLLERFLVETTANTLSLVVCGQCRQNTRDYAQFVTLRNETPTCVVPNVRTGEQLEVEVLDKRRLEIARRPLTAGARLEGGGGKSGRPLDSAAISSVEPKRKREDHDEEESEAGRLL